MHEMERRAQKSMSVGRNMAMSNTIDVVNPENKYNARPPAVEHPWNPNVSPNTYTLPDTSTIRSI